MNMPPTARPAVVITAPTMTGANTSVLRSTVLSTLFIPGHEEGRETVRRGPRWWYREREGVVGIEWIVGIKFINDSSKFLLQEKRSYIRSQVLFYQSKQMVTYLPVESYLGHKWQGSNPSQWPAWSPVYQSVPHKLLRSLQPVWVDEYK